MKFCRFLYNDSTFYQLYNQPSEPKLCNEWVTKKKKTNVTEKLLAVSKNSVFSNFSLDDKT